jgi:predicted nucleic acid-binding Zn ribbon protein
MSKACLECGDSFKGRSDKKFCSDMCRNAYNNRENNYTNNTIKRVNAILKKNRKIMDELNPDGKITVTGKRLRDLGYNFDYFTNIYRTRNGNEYFFTYEQGYIKLDKDFYTLVRRDEENKSD